MMPSASFVVVLATAPAVGRRASSGCVLTVSTYAVTGAAVAAVMTAAIFAVGGQRRPILLRAR